MKIPVSRIMPGDLINLENDNFADADGAHVRFQSEYVQVLSVEIETADCVAIGFDGFDTVGFPCHHMLDVCGHIAA